jgi:hypothetical protein
MARLAVNGSWATRVRQLPSLSVSLVAGRVVPGGAQGLADSVRPIVLTRRGGGNARERFLEPVEGALRGQEQRGHLAVILGTFFREQQDGP